MTEPPEGLSDADDGELSDVEVPECGAVYVDNHDGQQRYVCTEVGSHLCAARARRVIDIFEQILKHTKGRYAGAPFELDDWQRDDIIVPLFGTVRFSPEKGRYIRQFRIAWIELARKNGKSELLAAIALILLIADDEQGAEVYGAAKDRIQAGKVFAVALRMVQLSPILKARLKTYPREKRIVDLATNSFYEVATADPEQALGSNPHGIVFDEILTQPDGELWDAFESGMGQRDQPLMVAATTAGTDETGFCLQEHRHSVRVLEDPSIEPTRFVFLRNTPENLDPWLESTWRIANPALGSFLPLDSFRDMAQAARANPRKEQKFKQLNLNMWGSSTSRWLRSKWLKGCPDSESEPPAGSRCWGGVDLAAVSDLTSVCWLFGDEITGRSEAVWRHFLPEDKFETISEYSQGDAIRWRDSGLLTLTDGEVMDESKLFEVMGADLERWAVQSIGIDRWNSIGLSTWLQKEFPKVPAHLSGQGYRGMSGPMKNIEKLIRLGWLDFGGNDLARWCLQSTEIEQDNAENIKPVKPDRQADRYRIDATVSLAMADSARAAVRPKKKGRAAGF